MSVTAPNITRKHTQNCCRKKCNDFFSTLFSPITHLYSRFQQDAIIIEQLRIKLMGLNDTLWSLEVDLIRIQYSLEYYKLFLDPEKQPGAYHDLTSNIQNCSKCFISVRESRTLGDQLFKTSNRMCMSRRSLQEALTPFETRVQNYDNEMQQYRKYANNIKEALVNDGYQVEEVARVRIHRDELSISNSKDELIRMKDEIVRFRSPYPQRKSENTRTLKHSRW